MIESRLSKAALAIAAACTLNLSVYAGELRAGVGKASITPPASEFPFTAPGERAFVGVHDDVYARALVLDDGSKRVALVSLEVTRVPTAAELTKLIGQEIGVGDANVMLMATHTHNVLSASDHGGSPDPAHARDIERIKQGALAAVRQARTQLQPARVAFGRGEAWANINNGEQSSLKGGFDPRGPSDKTLDVIRFESRSGAPIALLVNYAQHAEVMFRSVTKDNGYEISGDMPGAVSRLLEDQPGAAPVVLFSAGAEGDQLTLFKSLQPAGRLPAADEGAAGWALLNVQARRLAESVIGVLSGMQAGISPGVSQVQIDAAVGVATCPGQRLRVDRQTGKVTTEDRPAVNIPLSIIKVNDIVLAGVGGDVGSDIGKRFRTASPHANSMLISMVGDPVGYILADANYERPGHGVAGSPLKPHCAEDAIVESLIRMSGSRP